VPEVTGRPTSRVWVTDMSVRASVCYNTKRTSVQQSLSERSSRKPHQQVDHGCGPARDYALNSPESGGQGENERYLTGGCGNGIIAYGGFQGQVTGNRIAEARSYPMRVGASPQVLSLTPLSSPCAALFSERSEEDHSRESESTPRVHLRESNRTNRRPIYMIGRSMCRRAKAARMQDRGWATSLTFRRVIKKRFDPAEILPSDAVLRETRPQAPEEQDRRTFRSR
jgi:hypothetical protein